MNKSAIVRCFFVSVVAAVLAALLSTTVLVVPDEGAMVPDLSIIDNNDLASSGNDKLGEISRHVPMRKLTVVERLTYPMTHPQYISMYFGSVFIWFIGLFIATLTVSHLNAKRTNDTT